MNRLVFQKKCKILQDDFIGQADLVSLTFRTIFEQLFFFLSYREVNKIGDEALWQVWVRYL